MRDQTGHPAEIKPQGDDIGSSKRLYRQRNCMERVLGHLKINRAIATRYDQLADSFVGILFSHRPLLDQICAPTARAPSSPRTRITKMESATSSATAARPRRLEPVGLLGAAAADGRPAGARTSRAREGNENGERGPCPRRCDRLLAKLTPYLRVPRPPGNSAKKQPAARPTARRGFGPRAGGLAGSALLRSGKRSPRSSREDYLRSPKWQFIGSRNLYEFGRQP